MSAKAFPPLDIVDQWPKLNEQIIDLIDVIPDDRMNWSPKPELWNFRGILIHINNSRHSWLNGVVKDGQPAPDVLRQGQTREGLREQFRASWARLQRFLSDAEKVGATYEDVWYGEPHRLSGHWIAYHLLEHDIHHRADIFHYLALLGIEHPQVTTP
jgi:uncharacterized damage-inducible protein DinB